VTRSTHQSCDRRQSCDPPHLAKEKPRHAEDRAKFTESVCQQRVDARRSGKEKPRPAHPLLALEAGLSSARSFAARDGAIEQASHLPSCDGTTKKSHSAGKQKPRVRRGKF
jgi:hypothetical protein